MRVLILSCSTGEGHNSCAKAIKECFDNHDVHCEITDTLQFISNGASKVVSGGHTFLYKHMPALFNWGYFQVENHTELYDENSPLAKIFNLGSKKLLKHIEKEDYDCIICTHPFSGMILTGALEGYNKPIKTALVATDFTCSPTAEKGDLDIFFTPDETLKSEFADKGVPEEKIVSVGIPVRQAFYEKKDKKQAKMAVGVNPEHAHMLIICGSMGCGPVEKLTRDLAIKVGVATEITVVCGRNKRLHRILSKAFEEYKNVRVLGFANNIHTLMDSADIFVTKPGGISTSEATVKALPMVLVDTVGGCEKYNLDFFLGKGAAVGGKKTDELLKLCIDLIEDEDQREEMVDNLKKITPPNAAEEIYKHMSNL